MLPTKVLSPLMVLLALSSVACSAPQGDEAANDREPVSDEPELNGAKASCGPSKYDEALAHYKAAVAKSSARVRGDVCGGGNYVSTIIADASDAISTCGAFRDVIKTSPWAKDLRATLADNLALPALTGELADNWANVSAELVGVRFYGPAPGAYGHMSWIELGADGSAHLELLRIAEDGSTSIERKAARWRTGVVSSEGTAALTIGIDGRDIDFVLEHEDGTPQAPSYRYRLEARKPVDGSLIETTFTSTPDECSA